MKLGWWLLLFHAAAIPVAISLSEGSGFLLALGGLVLFAKNPDVRKRIPVSFLIPVGLFITYAVLVSLAGIQPEGSGKKLYRFLAFGMCLSIPAFVFSRPNPLKSLYTLVGAYLLGVGILGVTDAVRIPLELCQGTALFDTGNMRDPQFYMTAILLSAGSGFFLVIKRPGLGWAGFVLFIAGLIFQFKRGAWLATLVSLSGLSVLRKKWVIIAALLVAAGIALLLPATRDRILQLQDVTQLTTGGRYALWTTAAPKLLQDYPWGVGFKQSTYELLRGYTMHIQPGLDHLHNNVLQIQVELGWGGLLLWIWIQISMLHLLIRSIRRSFASELTQAGNMGTALLTAFVGLHLNGMVEYNFGDTEILFLYTFIMGLGLALWSYVENAKPHHSDRAF